MAVIQIVQQILVAQVDQIKAFTIIETLIAGAIIAILVVIIAPAMLSSRLKAQNADSIARLRQIGLARSLYLADFSLNESKLVGVEILVDSDYIKKDFVSFLDDSTAQGKGNLIRSQDRLCRYRFRSSVLDLPGITIKEQYYNDNLEQRPKLGWLMNPGHIIFEEDDRLVTFLGYNRLLTEGAVLYRTSKKYKLSSSASMTIPMSYFFDDDTWIYEKLLKITQ